MYGFLRGLMRTMAHVYLGAKFEIEGLERIPRTGGLLVCSNHIGTIDPPLLPAVLPRGDSWSMAKSEWFAKPNFFRPLLLAYHAFPVVRHSADRAALRRAREILEEGHALVLYPEGTRVAVGGLRRAEPGAGYLARFVGVPVQPVAMTGTRECLPRGTYWPRRVPISVRFGPPIRIRERRPDGRRVANQEAADAIMVEIARLLPPELRGEYADLDGLGAGLAGVVGPA